jgi:tetratricopeptide (TPR) repeat protein
MARLPLLLVLFAGLYAPSALALQFWPSEIEWASWPDYCRARYVVSAAGRSSRFVQQVSPSESALWEKRMGDAWYALHHHCASLIYTQRAQHAKTKKERDYLLDVSIRNYLFTLERTPKENGMYPEMLTRMAMSYDLLGDIPHAMETLDTAIQLHPTFMSAYATKAMIFRRRGELSKAREILQAANAATNGESAEVHYSLGLLYLEEGDIDAAQEHARIAYSRGYPLPGLRRKLAAGGHAID